MHISRGAVGAPKHQVNQENGCVEHPQKPEESQERGGVMPLIQVKLIEGVFDEAQKQTMAQRLTDTMVEIEGENMRGVTWVLVEEVQSGHWAIGGQPLSTADVKALAAGVGVS
jgi:4-oxalocrotonate tautomerase